MSKYRILLSQSRYKVAVVIATHCFFVWSVFQWQAAVLQFQGVLQIVSSTVILCSLLWHLNHSESGVYGHVLVLCESARCEFEFRHKINQWEISADSRSSTWLIWLKFRSVTEPSECFWLWVFRDQVTDDDFRRISRVVLRSQQQRTLTTTNTHNKVMNNDIN